MNSAIIHQLLSMVFLALAGAFAMSMGAGLANGESWTDPSLIAFAQSVGVALGLAVIFHRLGRRSHPKLFRREALCAIGLSWILTSLVGALPYYLIVDGCSPADAIFETASGLTTTGATVFPGFPDFPASLLFWRSLSQWMGGLGVVVFFVALLSSLGAGAKILFSNESSGTSADFEHGRIQRGAFNLLVYYLALSGLCALGYRLAGMNWFQALNHAMTTTATGGFSTEAASIESFANPAIEWVAILFMTLSGTTFVFMIRLFRGRFQSLGQNNEVFWYFGILLIGTCSLILYLVEMTGELPGHETIRMAAFQCSSIMTTTGYSSTDFSNWLPPAKMTLLILMAVGSCSGSTGGGVKVVRIVIAVRAAIRSIWLAFRPNLTLPIRIGGRVLSESAIHSVIIFLSLVAAIHVGSTLILSAFQPEMSFLSVFSAVQATFFNIGPGFDAVGPAENFAFLKAESKLLLSLLMILGRLELYAVLVLFIPAAWRRFS